MISTAAYAPGSGVEMIILVDGPEAARTLALGPDDVDPTDIELAVCADVFDFAMGAESVDGVLRLTAAAGIAR